MTHGQLERIKIEGFRSIRALDLELGPINILIGANGSGKSNFLSFLTKATSATLRFACPRFDNWVSWLESLN